MWLVSLFDYRDNSDSKVGKRNFCGFIFERPISNQSTSIEFYLFRVKINSLPVIIETTKSKWTSRNLNERKITSNNKNLNKKVISLKHVWKRDCSKFLSTISDRYQDPCQQAFLKSKEIDDQRPIKLIYLNDHWNFPTETGNPGYPGWLIGVIEILLHPGSRKVSGQDSLMAFKGDYG